MSALTVAKEPVLTEEQQMIEGRKAQQFFREAINCCMEKSTDKFIQLVEDFMKRNAHVSFIDLFEGFQTEGKNLLHIGSSSGAIDIVKYILDRAGDGAEGKELIDRADEKGFTPLIYATNSLCVETMNMLIKRKPNVNAANCDGAAALHFAAGDGSLERLDLLIAAGADTSLSTHAGTALHWAAGKGHVAVVKRLLSLGINVNAADSSGLPAIFLAAVAGSDECTDLIASAPDVDVGAILSENLTLLHICAENGLEKAVHSIVKLPTGVKLAAMHSADKLLPIQLAAIAGHASIVKVLQPLSTTDNDICKVLTVEQILANGPEYLALWEEHHGKDGSCGGPAESETHAQAQQRVPPAESTDPASTPEAAARSKEFKDKGNRCYALDKDYAKAIDFYTQAIQLDGSNNTLWGNRSACYLALNNAIINCPVGDSEVVAVPSNILALRDAEICRSLDPKWIKGCYRLAMARLANNLFEDAAVAAFDGVTLDNNNADLKALLAKAVKLGQDDFQKKKKEQEDKEAAAAKIAKNNAKGKIN